MPTDKTIYLCQGLHDTRLETLAWADDVTSVVVGWDGVSEEPPPIWVREVLLHSILDIPGSTELAFLSDSPTQYQSKPMGIFSGLFSASLNWQVENATNNAMALFEQDKHQWSLKGQLVVGFKSSEPDWSSKALFQLLNREIECSQELFNQLNLWGLMAPGVDGEFAQLVFRNQVDARVWQESLNKERDKLSIKIESLSSDQFFKKYQKVY